MSNYWRIKKLGIELKGVNSLKFGCKESLIHRIVKTVVCHNLFQSGHYFKTEEHVRKAMCDVIDLTTFTIYEIEVYPTPKKIREKLRSFRSRYINDVIIIDLRKLKVDWQPLFELNDKVKRLLVE